MEVLSQSVQYDFHHLPEYHRLAEGRGEGVAHLFTYREDRYLIALPLMLRPVDPEIPDGWHDATSVYGYGGPVASHDKLPDPVVDRFQTALAAALVERRVVSAFSRLHPLLSQQALLAGLGECQVKGETISIDLTLPEDQQRALYAKRCRRSIRNLLRSGFVGVHDQEKRYLREFVAVYHATMHRSGAHPSYYFDESYFAQLAEELGSRLQLFVVLAGTKVAAASLATLCGDIAQDHLGGTSDEYLAYSPDRLVVDTERGWAQAMGARVLHLGGGVGSQRDSVFHYKTGFSPRRHTFSTWCHIVFPEVYDALCLEKARCGEANALSQASTQYFPAYRSPIMASERPPSGQTALSSGQA
ncbi:MAG: hypothetical protein QOE70_6701 [Chthoniobacter sp.]|nr:hypothetical protein [Chthoniobacter sp.]